ncbi:hypothetical protein [Streptomyces sp. NPDC059479]|uniref:hypothetical protein n=1 Tax=Streptomyces sp. NPDC059479 TaxID=3346848 RepID=UPI0036CA26D1
MSDKPRPLLWQLLTRRIAARRQAKAIDRAREAALVSLGEALARLAALREELIRRELQSLDNAEFFEQVFGHSPPEGDVTE